MAFCEAKHADARCLTIKYSSAMWSFIKAIGTFIFALKMLSSFSCRYSTPWHFWLRHSEPFLAYPFWHNPIPLRRLRILVTVQHQVNGVGGELVISYTPKNRLSVVHLIIMSDIRSNVPKTKKKWLRTRKALISETKHDLFFRVIGYVFFSFSRLPFDVFRNDGGVG